MTIMTKPMTPPSTETIMTVKVLSTSFTEKREKGKDIVRGKGYKYDVNNAEKES